MKLKFVLMIFSIYIWICSFVVLAVFNGSANAGDISGAPAMLPPNKDRNFYFMLSNDFLGRGGESDDFRTQQIGVQARLIPRWGVLFDHSILTAGINNSEVPGQSGRIDQINASLMYQVYHSRPNKLHLQNISAGFGLRSYGNYGGSRIQNGFHRLINGAIRDFSYIDESRDDATTWVKGSFERMFSLSATLGVDSAWLAGYWLDAVNLVTTDGQWDGTVAANAVMRKNKLNFWLGVRADWRENYHRDFVTKATAESETGLFATLGVEYGPVIFETVQSLGDKPSYGLVVFSCVEDRLNVSHNVGQDDHALNLNFLFPDVELEIQYRHIFSRRLNYMGNPRTWLLVELHYGKPTYQDSIDIFNTTSQLAIGMELEWCNRKNCNWAWPYLSVLAGQRSEQLSSDGSTLSDQNSDKVSSLVLETGTGIRFLMYENHKWQFLFQIGIVGRYPVSSKNVRIENQTFEVLEPDLSFTAGLSLII